MMPGMVEKCLVHLRVRTARVECPLRVEDAKRDLESVEKKTQLVEMVL